MNYHQDKRRIDKIIIHCTASSDDEDVGVKEIDRWHKARGWRGIGYHLVIRRNGVLENGRPLEQPGAHCEGANKNSIGVCLVGIKNFTAQQFETLRGVCQGLKKAYPKATFHPHNEFPTAKAQGKTCPNFDIKEKLKGVI